MSGWFYYEGSLDGISFRYSGDINVDVACGSCVATEVDEFEGVALNANAVQLNWNTQLEVNNEAFKVERSEDGLVFGEIGEVLGAGLAYEPVDYQYLDEEAAGDKLYYRLRQKNFSGVYLYSEVIEVNLEENSDLHYQIYPNPFKSQLYVKAIAPEDGVHEYVITDAQGRELFRGGLNQSGKTLLNTERLQPGMYFLRIFSPKGYQFVGKIEKLY